MRVFKEKRAGLSLLEVVIAAAMMTMLMTAIYAIAEMLQRSQIVTGARVEARQALRSGANRFLVTGSGANHFYRAPDDSTVYNINGVSCSLPYKDSGDWVAGDTVIIAVPQDTTRPIDSTLDPLDPDTDLYPPGSPNAVPDGFPDHDCSIVVLTTQLREKTSRTPNARNLVLMRWDDVTPAVPGEVSSVDLEDLGNPTHVSVYDAFLKPLDEDGFVVNYLEQEGVPISTCRVKASFRHVPTQGSTQEETYEFIFTTRN